MHRKWLKWTLVVLAALFALGFAGLSYVMGGPRDAYGFLRYALPVWRRGPLHVGSRAPDVELVALDGVARFHLADRLGRRPLVLILGSYT